MSVKQKINQRMDELQAMMEENVHIKDPLKVEQHISSVSKFWSALSEEDRDYIHGARYALEEQMEWKL